MSSLTTPSVQARAAYLPVALAICLYTVVVLKSAWLSDDAYITFRTVDNFVSGYGLTWNVDERVQAYTHPLWMLLLSATYWFTREIHFTSILLCVVFSVATVFVFAGRVAVSAFPALIGVAIFTLSKAFVDYSTSGLDNPLTHLLLMLFLWVYLTRPADRKSLLWLSLLAAMIVLNRMDGVLLVLPALCVAVYRVGGWRSLRTVALGFAPFIAWEAFALFYYGSLFPNTAYAKLNTGLSAGAQVGQGLLYFLVSLKMDPLTLIVIVAGLAAPFILRERRHAPLALGAALYLCFVIWIGGDFMVGRFFTPPLLVAVVLLTRVTPGTLTSCLMFLLILLIGILPSRSPITSGEDYGMSTNNLIREDGICDERAYYYQGTGLLMATDNIPLPSHTLEKRGRAARVSGQKVVVAKAIGMHGFFAGPGVHIVDELALADPLLAHLPPTMEDWRVGHYRRKIPAGYLETLKTGRNCLADAHLAAYYDKIRLITRGRLFDPQRWLAIIKLNLGAYNSLLAPAHP